MKAVQSHYKSIESVRNEFEDALEGLVVERMSSKNNQPAMEIARDVLMAGGKRYRPILGLLAYEAMGGKDKSEVMSLALSAELIHTATLVHDDIYDQAKTRRGKPTIHTTHGLAHAIIVGDYLFALGYELGANYNPEVVDRVGASCAGVASGELLQFKHIGDLGTKPEDYYAIIDGKTAGPFATGCSCAGIVAEADREEIDGMWHFGLELGRAFQLVDDLLDITGDESIGKPRGTDVHEGKMTLPIIHSLTMLHGLDREQLADVITNFSDDRWGELYELLERSDSLEYTRLLISNHVDRAKEQLHWLPSSGAKDLMAEIVEMSKTRTK